MALDLALPFERRKRGRGIEKLSRPETCHSLERRVRSGLPVHSVECALLGGMLVNAHGHVEGFLDAGHRPRHIHEHAIAGGFLNREAARLRESDQGVVIFLAGTKSRCELFHREEMPVGRAGGIIKFLQEVFQLRLMAQCQHNVEAHGLGCGKPSDGLCLSTGNRITRVTGHRWLRRCLANDIHDRHHRGEREQEYAESLNHNFSLDVVWCQFPGRSFGPQHGTRAHTSIPGQHA